METTPPTDPTHRQLWAMGFDENERNELIEVWPENPIELGHFISEANAETIMAMALKLQEIVKEALADINYQERRAQQDAKLPLDTQPKITYNRSIA